MKHSFAIFSLAVLGATSTIAHAQFRQKTFETLAQEINAPIENVFIPMGFDSNDNAEVVISGTFPNSCYKMGKTTHGFNEVEKNIYIKVSAYHIKSDYCLTMNIPFLQVVPLGTLGAAKYPIIVNDVINTEIPIAEADLETRDDFVYASVYGIVQKGARTFEIQAVTPNACYEISKVDVRYESKNVVTILPIMTKLEGCDELENTKAVSQLKQVELSADLKGKTLVHVRTLNGGSINQVVDFQDSFKSMRLER